MKREDHFLLTFSLSLFIYYFLFKYNLFLTIFLSFLTAQLSWLPDVDLKIINKINRLKKNHKIIYFLFFPVFFLLKVVFKHRTITHSFWIPFTLLILDFLFVNNFLVKILLETIYLAILLHILEDSLTKKGVKPFYPEDFILRFPLFNTNNEFHSFLIKIIAFSLLISFIVLVFKSYLLLYL